MANIISNKSFDLDAFNPDFIAKEISKNVKERRLELNITQQELAKRSGVSWGSIKRFENKGEISLKHLLLLAVALDSMEGFSKLFTQKKYQTLDDVNRENAIKKRKRAR